MQDRTVSLHVEGFGVVKDRLVFFSANNWGVTELRLSVPIKYVLAMHWMNRPREDGEDDARLFLNIASREFCIHFGIASEAPLRCGPEYGLEREGMLMALACIDAWTMHEESEVQP